MHGRRVKLMLYNQPKQSFRKEVDIGTLRHVVQRLFMGLAPVVATASFPTYKSPKFHLSFTILVSFILVKYPDRIGLVNTVPACTGTASGDHLG